MSRSEAVDRSELIEAYQGLGVREGAILYVPSNLGKVLPHHSVSGAELAAAHFDALRTVIGPSGTIVVPTATLNLVNTDTVYDPAETPGWKMGVFSEYVRSRPDARRSVHPFWSCAAVGAEAGQIVDNISRHAYGYGSVFQRLADHPRALAVHIGILPRMSFSIIHRLEAMVGVPYRYTKEFVHPSLTADGVEYGEWYLDVIYRDIDAPRDRNKKLWAGVAESGIVREHQLARGRLWAFEVRAFMDVALKLMIADPYIWLSRPPERRPYRT